LDKKHAVKALKWAIEFLPEEQFQSLYQQLKNQFIKGDAI
jgi:hypothetical protein